MAVSGLRKSCETVLTRSSFIRSTRLRSVISRNTSMVPTRCAPRIIGVTVISTGNEAPS